MIKNYLRSVRRKIFRFLNRLRFNKLLSQVDDQDKVLVMVLIPGLVHLAIPSIRLLGNRNTLIIINNGLNESEKNHLCSSITAIKLFKLYTNRFSGAQMVDTHPEVIETLTETNCNNMIFIDADCYVFDKSLITKIFDQLTSNLFVSPFWFENHQIKQKVPETFLLGLNIPKLKKLKQKYNFRFGDLDLSSPLKKLAEEKWGKPVPWLQPWKKIYDTIHIAVIAGLVENMSSYFIETKYGDIYHVCGTSYNHNSFSLNTTVDGYIINAHYFHLQIIEALNSENLNYYFSSLIKNYGDSKGLKIKYPDYANSTLHAQIEELIKKLKVLNLI
jgi:hypothetical protein